MGIIGSVFDIGTLAYGIATDKNVRKQVVCHYQGKHELERKGTIMAKEAIPIMRCKHCKMEFINGKPYKGDYMDIL